MSLTPPDAATNAAKPPDHFSAVASQYAQFRPHYPAALFDFLAGAAPDHQLAWDCGTGTGISAVPLARRFTEVIATDMSAAQLAQAPAHPGVTWRVAREGDSGLEAQSASLVIAAQAAHWFDIPAFYREVARVLRPDGVLAIWCYGSSSVEPALDPVLHWFEHERMGPYWPSGREHINAGYSTLAFPYPRMEVPTFAMESTLDRQGLLGYIGSWSAVDRCRKAEGRDPLPELERALVPLWADKIEKVVRWPLTILAGRAPGAS